MDDQVISFGPESFKILHDGTIVVESQKLKELIADGQNQVASFEILNAWLEVTPTTT